MIKEIERKEIGTNGVVHTYKSYVEIPEELIKPKKKAKKDALEN